MNGNAQQCYVGIDLGGTTINAVCILGDGAVLARKRVATLSQEGAEAVIGRLAQLIVDIMNDVRDRATVGGIGVAVAGVVDRDTGTTIRLPNFPGSWYGIPLGPRLQQQFGLPSFILNDARAATLGEKTFGAGRHARNMVMFTLGTGIGGGIVIDGELYFGSEGHAGEVGHQTIDQGGPLCGCGNTGCMEALGSGPAIASMAIRAVKQGMTTSIRDMVGNDLNKISPKTVSDAANAGDTVAIAIIKMAGGYIGTGVANLIVILNPDTVVIGGGVANAGSLLFQAIEDTVSRRVCILPGGRGAVRIAPAELGDEAGAVGVAAWAMKRSGRS
jgi:glucokinase